LSGHRTFAPPRTHIAKVFKYEAFLLAAVTFYLVFFLIGSKINRTKANTWFVAFPEPD
jgi:hypothetical protein